MKHLLGLLTLSLQLIGGAAHAQDKTEAPAAASSDEDDDDEIYQYYYETLSAMGEINENCKAVLEPTYYEGFKVLLRVYYGEMGATDADIQKEEANAIEFADYLCKDKAACWRGATGLPATATPEEGRERCMAMMANGFKELDSYFPDSDTPAN